MRIYYKIKYQGNIFYKRKKEWLKNYETPNLFDNFYRSTNWTLTLKLMTSKFTLKITRFSFTLEAASQLPVKSPVNYPRTYNY